MVYYCCRFWRKPLWLVLRFRILAGSGLLALLGAGGSFPAAAQLVGPVIELRPGPVIGGPRGFYVAQVVDARPERVAVAQLLVPVAGRTSPTVYPVELAGGSLQRIRQFVSQALPPTSQLRPVTIRLQAFQLTETVVPGAAGQVEGRLRIALAFEWQRDGRTIHLTDYHGSARYVRPRDQLTVVEPTLRQGLTSALQYLTVWMQQQVPINPQLATGIQLGFSYYTRSIDDDTVFYAPNRPLTWADFRGQPRPGPALAVVYPSFSYKAAPRLVDGRLQVTYQLKVFVIKSSSWVAADGRTPAVLNHEQQHFAIARLVAERFRRRLQTDPRLTVDYYQEGHLEYRYLLALQEMTRLQAQYDEETHADPAAQERWNQRIESELQSLTSAP